jgi:protein-tyrosine phosphatase
MTKLLIVCAGNICRSPMAQVVMHHLATKGPLATPLAIDSAGTHAPGVSERMDPRARAALARCRYEAGQLRSRQVTERDCHLVDLILAMDHRNLADLQRLCPVQHQHKLHLFMSFAPELGETFVPDPYYGNAQGFDNVIRLCEAGAMGLLLHIKETRQSDSST